MSPQKRTLIVPTEYEGISNDAPCSVNANILLHNYPGGIRSERIVPENILNDWGYIVDGTSIYDPSSKVEYSGVTLRDAIDDLSHDNPVARSLSRAMGRDPVGECRDYIQTQGLEYDVIKYLFNEVPVEEVENQLSIARLYRRLKGKPLNTITKWSQSDDDGKQLPYAHGYERYKFGLQVDGDVYLAGRGGNLRQIEAGIKTSGKIRVTDRRNGEMPDVNPDEEFCIGNENAGSGEGLAGCEGFYHYYEGWRNAGKKVWFQARIFSPPPFPCLILQTTRPHNEEVICYTDLSVVDIPDWKFEIAKIGRANARRNADTRDGTVSWPAFDSDVVEELLCAPLKPIFNIPDKVNLERRVDSKARFPLWRSDMVARCKMDRPAYVHVGISASVMIYMLCCQQSKGEEFLMLDILDYPNFAAHQDVEECIWSFEATARAMGLKRIGNVIAGFYTKTGKENFLRFIEKHVGRF
jgi:hypothetical protein